MAKKGNVAIQDEINNNEDWKNMLEKPGIYVVDIYTEWSGPCVPMVVFLRKIKLELNNENLHFAIAKSDEISTLERFHQKSEPHWMFLFDGKLVNLIIDTNGPRLLKTITDEVEKYEKFKRGEIEIVFLPINKVTDEERRKLMERNEYELQKFNESNKIKNERMMKVKEYHLKKFSLNVQMHTCVMFFPHTVSYVMVEKVPEEGAEDFDESAEPVMVEKRICEVANTCALKYEDFMVVEAKEIQLTLETLEEMFLMERNVLASFSPRLVDELLSKKVFSVLLSLPVIKNEGQSAIEEEDPTKYWGLPEEKMSTIIYGNQNPVNPSPKSLAADNIVVNNFGEKVPSIYTPTNPLSKASALTVLFNKFSITNEYVAPQPPAPQYLLIFEINKSDIVLPIIEDIEDNIINYGFFRSADPENPRLLCKNHELLVTYGMEKIGKDAKLVLSVIKDYKDKSMLRFIDAGPIYVSTDSVLGIDDAAQFFPYNFEEMEGEIKMLVDRFFHSDEATDGEYGLDEGNDEFLGEDDIEEQLTPDIAVH